MPVIDTLSDEEVTEPSEIEEATTTTAASKVNFRLATFSKSPLASPHQALQKAEKLPTTTTTTTTTEAPTTGAVVEEKSPIDPSIG